MSSIHNTALRLWSKYKSYFNISFFDYVRNMQYEKREYESTREFHIEGKNFRDAFMPTMDVWEALMENTRKKVRNEKLK